VRDERLEAEVEQPRDLQEPCRGVLPRVQHHGDELTAVAARAAHQAVACRQGEPGLDPGRTRVVEQQLVAGLDGPEPGQRDRPALEQRTQPLIVEGRARQGGELLGGEQVLVGEAARIDHDGVGEPETVGVLGHQRRERLGIPGDMGGEHLGRVVARADDDAVEELLDRPLVTRGDADRGPLDVPRLLACDDDVGGIGTVEDRQRRQDLDRRGDRSTQVAAVRGEDLPRRRLDEHPRVGLQPLQRRPAGGQLGAQRRRRRRGQLGGGRDGDDDGQQREPGRHDGPE
jgi:hypothetical protein